VNHLNKSREKAGRITLLVSDVDGVLTDGSIYIGEMGEQKKFTVVDGMGVALARFTPLQIALLSGRHSEATSIRARELQLEENVYQGYLNKLTALKEIRDRFQVEPGQIAYIGDDYVDIPVMRAVGLPFAVPNARPVVKEQADCVLETHGGEGALTEAIEFILEARGELQGAIEQMEKDVYQVDEEL